MAHGIKKHLKRLRSPKGWKLSKLGGIWAPNPKSGPHKKFESFPLILIIRNRLKYALNNQEAVQILQQGSIKVDKKIRTEKNYPAGLMDIISIEKTKENFRLLLDTFGKFLLHRIEEKESLFKLCKVIKSTKGQRGIPYIITHDGRSIRFPDPFIKINDTVLFDLSQKKIIDFIKFEIGSLCIITGGPSVGKIGIITHLGKNFIEEEKIKLKDVDGIEFFSKFPYIFVIGKGKKSFISLPKTKRIGEIKSN
jgi:small subunit ribosomal protein S4e